MNFNKVYPQGNGGVMVEFVRYLAPMKFGTTTF